MDGQDVFLCILAFFIPPLGLAMKIGVHNKAFLLNVLLTVIALPFGMAHAIFTIKKVGQAAKLSAHNANDPVHPLASQHPLAQRGKTARANAAAAQGIHPSRSYSSSQNSLVYGNTAPQPPVSSRTRKPVPRTQTTNAYGIQPVRSPSSITNEKGAPPDYAAS